MKHYVWGGFVEPLFQTLQNDPELLSSVADLRLKHILPESLHVDISNAAGLPRGRFDVSRRLKRDPWFRLQVLTAYQYRCAICDFNMRLRQQSVRLGAAHIECHQAGGPDMIGNDLCLCVLFQKKTSTLADNYGTLRRSLEHDMQRYWRPTHNRLRGSWVFPGFLMATSRMLHAYFDREYRNKCCTS